MTGFIPEVLPETDTKLVFVSNGLSNLECFPFYCIVSEISINDKLVCSPEQLSAVNS